MTKNNNTSDNLGDYTNFSGLKESLYASQVVTGFLPNNTTNNINMRKHLVQYAGVENAPGIIKDLEKYKLKDNAEEFKDTYRYGGGLWFIIQDAIDGKIPKELYKPTSDEIEFMRFKHPNVNSTEALSLLSKYYYAWPLITKISPFQQHELSTIEALMYNAKIGHEPEASELDDYDYNETYSTIVEKLELKEDVKMPSEIMRMPTTESMNYLDMARQSFQ